MNPSNSTPETFDTEIEKLVYGGSGLGRFRGKVVFVPYSVPGDRLLVRKVLEKKNYIRAEILKTLNSGPGRVDPVCPHFGRCGGCHWQHLEYPRQVDAKLLILKEIFHHSFPETHDIPIRMKACPQPMGYRSRARLQVRNSDARRFLGFFRAGSHDVEVVDRCPLLRSPLNRALQSLQSLISDDGIDADVREIDIAGAYEGDMWTATPVASPNAPEDRRYGMGNDAVSKEILLKRKVGEFLYSVAAPVFFQANDFMVADLVQLVRELSDDTGLEAAVDLFAGVGLFSIPLASKYKSVIAVENSPAACRLCRENAAASAVDSLRTVCSDVEQWLESETSGRVTGYDLILLDPPRSGAGAGVMGKIRSLAPQTILYVSCDPQTLCRDLSFIPPEEYIIERIEGLDMFPQTYHFETVVRLVRR